MLKFVDSDEKEFDETPDAPDGGWTDDAEVQEYMDSMELEAAAAAPLPARSPDVCFRAAWV